MRISQSFDLAHPRERVWELFQDLPAVVHCIPGARLIEDPDDGSFIGRVEAHLGPVTAAFEGDGVHTPEPSDWTGRIEGSERDREVGSRAKVAIQDCLESVATTTRVRADSDVTLPGTAAQFGCPGLVLESSARPVHEFGENLELQIERPSPEGPAGAASPKQMGSLVFVSLWTWLRSALRRLLGIREVE